MNKLTIIQYVIFSYGAKNNITLAEQLSLLLQGKDWMMGVYGIPLDDLTDRQMRAKKAHQLAALDKLMEVQP